MCVQGAPGTGKTAVGLHRAAWLLYAHRDRLTRSGVLVVGPNAAFLEHVAAVLPSLGEVQVRHTTVDALVAGSGGPERAPGGWAPTRCPARCSRATHGWRRCCTARPGVTCGTPTDAAGAAARIAALAGARRVPWPTIVTELRDRGVRYAAARDMLAQRLAHAVLVLMEAAGDSPDDRVQDAVARSREVRRYVDVTWPAIQPAQVLHRLLSDAAFLAECADGPPRRGRAAGCCCWPRPPRSAGSARWSPADPVLLDELADVLHRTPSIGHIVLDEAQDLSAMQLRAVGRRCSTGSMTVLGDIAQGTTAWATASWQAVADTPGPPRRR